MTRALVLSGGGPVGIAWQSGLIAGFAQGGVDLGAADLILGVSAGAVVGARLAGGVPATALADMFAAALAETAPPAVSAEASARVAELLEESHGGARNPAEVRRELGELALAAETMGEAEFLQRVGGDLTGVAHAGWPGPRYACAGVDAGDGGFQLWDAASGVDLLPAVAASCAIPGVYPPIAVDGRRYFDGGARSLANADLAAGHDLVVLVFVETPGLPAAARVRVMEEVELLKASDSTVVVVTPEEGSADAVADLALPADAARAGLLQGLSQVEILKTVWGVA